MSCTDVQKQLDDYVDDGLPAEDRRSVAEHLRKCLTCRRSLTELEDLLSEARRLPKEIEPEAQLWSTIESRIQATATVAGTTGQGFGPSWWSPHRGRLAAAAIVALAIATPLALRLIGSDVSPEPAIAKTDNETPSTARALASEMAVLARAEDGVLLPRTDLVESLQRNRADLPPETLAAVQEDAWLIDQAIAELRAALEESPENRRLQLLLAARYQQEVDLLKRVNRV